MNGQYAALLIAVPLISAFFVPLLKGAGKNAIKYFLIAVTALQTGIAALVFQQVYTTGQPIIVMAGGWKPPVGINLYFGHFAALFVLIVAVVSFLMAIFSLESIKVEPIDKYAMLFLLLMLGATGMIATGDIFNLFVFMEITAISAYALTAYNKTGEAAEASMKYIVLGGIGSSFFLIGVALIYGSLGTLNMAQIAQLAATMNPTVAQVGLALIIFGLAVEAEIFPLNAWAPDAYQAAPHPITAMFSAFVVKAGLYAMARIIYLMQDVGSWGSVLKLLVVLATLTVIVAELAALRQRDVKRMIAYSSIAQIGLIALAFALGTQSGVDAGVFHMVNHAIVKAMLFLAVGYVAMTLGGAEIENFKGLGRRMPLMAFAISVGAIATVGIPLFNIFWSKVRIILATLQVGYTWAAVLVLAASVVEAVYYFRLLHVIWFEGDGEKINENLAIGLMVLFLAALVVVIGIYPDYVWSLAQKAGNDIFNVASYIKNVPLMGVGA
ncbi:proton-conducting transporter transmembrane domain-containing protein [Thermococcus thioreducens]|uniref:Membrane bound protein complex subunit mbxH n=1 Tax=Thermococcus thioreducens TaxID=277988 RepID=A0A0Q2XNZ1_9EURY|nr:proton-conducting transporter membrane subunit [Thermococcus thioreducens]ASJ12257.1 NADH dehydrogenase [Thermococcus thioreducens]KQH82996.1 NADH dehydrogenase [Thermococcus thioreducens]SEV94012.1 Membrane bound protein complex subunit mbxH [Thermococcus thioreducens]